MSDSIREMFYNLKGFNTVEIVLTAFEKDISIFYHLNDNPVQHAWQTIHSDSNKFSMGVSHGQPLESLVEQLNLLLTNNNMPTVDASVDQEQLNKLHNNFVGGEFNSEDAVKINLLIHAIENKNNILTEFDSTTVFYKDLYFDTVPLKEEYKLWLVNDNTWGHLLLGFGTVGKSWNEIAETDDNLDDLNIQTTISSETAMVFNVDYPYLKAPERLFYNWATNSKYNVPLDNLNQLALGRYLLGEVIITDIFLNYHPNVSDWYVPNHRCKLLWNRDILGYNAKVKEIKFFNSDMYFNTLISHTDFQNI